MIAETEIRTYHTCVRQGRAVKVILEFPGESDKKARQELSRGLKAIYLERIKSTAESEFAAPASVCRDRGGSRLV